MVRRLNFTVVWRILLAGSRRIIDMQIRSVGIDLGKTTFHLVALSAAGTVLLRKKFTQKQLIIFTANLQATLIGLEACSGAHFLGRALRGQGHDVKPIPAQFVKPFVKSNKNDFLDAEAIAEAVGRQNMRFVPIKTDDQLDLQALHRVRDRLITRRTFGRNSDRGFDRQRCCVPQVARVRRLAGTGSSTRPAARQSSTASVSEAIATCARSSSMEHAPWSCAASET